MAEFTRAEKVAILESVKLSINELMSIPNIQGDYVIDALFKFYMMGRQDSPRMLSEIMEENKR